jgi:ABC-type nickel/cobalt efflux system permease component RcnA
MADMTKPGVPLAAKLALGAFLLALVTSHATAQSSLGIGTNEATVPSTGLFGGLMQWVNAQQQAFYRSLTDSLKAMREDTGQVWILIGLSFAYGVFHAAGPGHGKAVISSYMLANEVALRRGIMLSFVSAGLQAVTAILLMAAVFLLLRGTSVSTTDATLFLERTSYALIAAFGAWLLWRKTRPLIRARRQARMHSLSAAHVHDHRHHAGNHGDLHDHQDHGEGTVCATCGHGHVPDPKALSGDRFTWKTAWSAVAAVGLRPCSGALIVLTFAFLNRLWLGGIASVFAMALGTAITVSVLAAMAVMAKNWAVALSGGGRIGERIHQTIETAGAALVLMLGLTLLTASFSA